MPESLALHRLILGKQSRLGPDNLIRKPATDNQMMALAESGFSIIGQRGEAWSQLSSKENSALLDKAAVETQDGVSIWIDMQVSVGRKHVYVDLIKTAVGMG